MKIIRIALAFAAFIAAIGLTAFTRPQKQTGTKQIVIYIWVYYDCSSAPNPIINQSGNFSEGSQGVKCPTPNQTVRICAIKYINDNNITFNADHTQVTAVGPGAAVIETSYCNLD